MRHAAWWVARDAPCNTGAVAQMTLRSSNASTNWRQNGHVSWRRLHVLLDREHVVISERRLRRIYRGAGLQVRPRKKRHVRYVRGSVVRSAP